MSLPVNLGDAIALLEQIYKLYDAYRTVPDQVRQALKRFEDTKNECERLMKILAQSRDADLRAWPGAEDFETDSEGEYVGIRRRAEERLARPGKERNLIEQAEAIWVSKVEEQRERADGILAALVKLFAHMPSLKAIEIQQWHCDLSYYGFVDGIE